MLKTTKFGFLIIFLAGLLLFSTKNVRACSCITPPFDEMFDSSTSVFEGTVIHIGTPEGDGVHRVEVTFQVLKVWKGESRSTIVIYTEEQSTACGYPFGDNLGRTYLVYAYEYDGQLSTNRCTRTRLRSNAFGDLLMLNLKINRLGVSAVAVSMVLIAASVLTLRKKRDRE